MCHVRIVALIGQAPLSLRRHWGAGVSIAGGMLVLPSSLGADVSIVASYVLL